MRLWVGLAFVVATGCGPIAYVKQVTFSADDKVERAREAGADKYSPYWWTRATQYLHMSRDVAAHADYQGANKFGRLAAEAADNAYEEASNPAKRPVNPMDTTPAKDKTDVAPAKDDKAEKAEKKDKKDKDVAPAKEEP